MSSSYRSGAALITLRHVEAADEPFLLALSVQVMAAATPELALLPGHLERVSRSQRDQWAARYGERGHQLVLLDGVPVGRLWLAHEGDDGLCIVHIALLEDYRGQGLGAALLRDVIAQAQQAQRRLWLHVALDNPAQHLYLRHGFVCTWRDALYMKLERSP